MSEINNKSEIFELSEDGTELLGIKKPKQEKYVIPDGVKVIKTGSLDLITKSVKELIMPDSVEIMEDNSFTKRRGNDRPTLKITFSNSLKRIGKGNIAYRTSDGILRLPESLEELSLEDFSFINTTDNYTVLRDNEYREIVVPNKDTVIDQLSHSLCAIKIVAPMDSRAHEIAIVHDVVFKDINNPEYEEITPRIGTYLAAHREENDLIDCFDKCIKDNAELVTKRKDMVVKLKSLFSEKTREYYSCVELKKDDFVFAELCVWIVTDINLKPDTWRGYIATTAYRANNVNSIIEQICANYIGYEDFENKSYFISKTTYASDPAKYDIYLTEEGRKKEIARLKKVAMQEQRAMNRSIANKEKAFEKMVKQNYSNSVKLLMENDDMSILDNYNPIVRYSHQHVHVYFPKENKRYNYACSFDVKEGDLCIVEGKYANSIGVIEGRAFLSSSEEKYLKYVTNAFELPTSEKPLDPLANRGPRKFIYDVIDKEKKTAKIKDYCSINPVMIVPSEVDGYKITSIGGYSFKNRDLKLVVISEGITKIEECSFNECNKLEGVYFPDSIKIIYENTFFKCKSLSFIRLPDKTIKIKKGALMSGATTGRYSFGTLICDNVECPSLKESFIKFPNVSIIQETPQTLNELIEKFSEQID